MPHGLDTLFPLGEDKSLPSWGRATLRQVRPFRYSEGNSPPRAALGQITKTFFLPPPTPGGPSHPISSQPKRFRNHCGGLNCLGRLTVARNWGGNQGGTLAGQRMSFFTIQGTSHSICFLVVWRARCLPGPEEPRCLQGTTLKKSFYHPHPLNGVYPSPPFTVWGRVGAGLVFKEFCFDTTMDFSFHLPSTPTPPLLFDFAYTPLYSPQTFLPNSPPPPTLILLPITPPRWDPIPLTFHISTPSYNQCYHTQPSP